MTEKRHRLLLLVFAAACTLPAAAQNVYRCGDSYSQQPCAGGKAVAVDDARTAGQRAQTTEAVRRDAKAANELEKARLKEEGKPVAASIPLPKAEELPPAGDRTESAVKPKKPAYFTAVSPKKPGDKAPKKKKKAKAKKSAG